MIFFGDETPAGVRETSERALLMLAIGAVWLASLVYAYALGTDRNVRMALDAFEVAHEANYRLEIAVGMLAKHHAVAEKAVRVCLLADAELHEALARTPVEQSWPDRTFTVDNNR